MNDGGAAFPHKHLCSCPTCGGGGKPGSYGMSLRDYFAAKAMASMVAGPGARMVSERDGRYDETNWGEIVALNAYEIADAMLAERAKADQR